MRFAWIGGHSPTDDDMFDFFSIKNNVFSPVLRLILFDFLSRSEPFFNFPSYTDGGNHPVKWNAYNMGIKHMPRTLPTDPQFLSVRLKCQQTYPKAKFR